MIVRRFGLLPTCAAARESREVAPGGAEPLAGRGEGVAADPETGERS